MSQNGDRICAHFPRFRKVESTEVLYAFLGPECRNVEGGLGHGNHTNAVKYRREEL